MPHAWSARAAATVAALALATGLAPGQATNAPTVAQRIDAILGESSAAHTHWGILARDLDTGAAIYERNAAKLFAPASNVKLLTTALALSRLGTEHRFVTTVVADGTIGEDGQLAGDLRLVGGGDPNLSSRVLPQADRPVHGADRLAPLRELARQVRAAGVRAVSGNVIGDDTRYVWQRYPPGWSWRDTLQAYGSRATALAFNDNLVQVRITPGSPGAPARVSRIPDLSHFRLVNRTRTSSQRFVSRTLSARRGLQPGEVILSGLIPAQSRGRTLALAAEDPALYAASAFKRALEDEGIRVSGRAATRHRTPDRLESLRSGRPSERRAEKELARLDSASVADAVRVVNKQSENLHAEMLLREVALLEAGIGSQEAAVDSLARFLAQAGVGTLEFFLRDGSGLSRHNLLSPRGTVAVLEHMWHSAHRDTFADSLPIAGEDGTLDWRFRRSPARGRIRAKTGSMTHVTALSGYARTASGTTAAFSAYANQSGLASSATRRTLDRVAEAIAAPR